MLAALVPPLCLIGACSLGTGALSFLGVHPARAAISLLPALVGGALLLACL